MHSMLKTFAKCQLLDWGLKTDISSDKLYGLKDENASVTPPKENGEQCKLP